MAAFTMNGMSDETLNNWTGIFSLSKHAIKLCKGDEEVAIFISDCVNIWSEKLSFDDFIQRCQERGISGTLDSFLEEILRMAGLPDEKQEFSIAGDSNERATLTLRKSVQISATSKAKLSIQFSLQKLSAQELFHHVTLPLTVTCWQLQKQNEELMKIIASKDNEIAEYKANNSINIARKNLITKPFNKPAFKEKHSTSQIPDKVFLSPATALGDLQEFGSSWQRMEALQIVQPWSVPGGRVKTEVTDVAPEPKKPKEMPKIKEEKVPKVPAPPVLLRKPKRIL